ncbi:MAG: cytochrome c3 family protein, partial [Myxococcales bacterium]|nr:cytochrome c3 family protein [Myxococcales bacterium]
MTISLRPIRVAALPILATLGLAAAPSLAGAQADAGCDLCHGEVELLRQHVPSLAEAQRLTVSSGTILASAHADQSCGDCHTGYGRWPHPDNGTTETCVSCHEEQSALWESGLHAHPRLDELEPADCVACHGLHEILTLDDLREDDGIRAMNAGCVACHETQALGPDDPHADTVSCASCHAPHATLDVDDEAAGVAPRVQPETC